MSRIPCKQSKRIEMTGILKSGICYWNLLLKLLEFINEFIIEFIIEIEMEMTGIYY